MNVPDGVSLEHASCCSLGCDRNDEVVLTGRDLFRGLPGEFAVVRCRTCGLMRTTPRPTPDTMRFYYPDDYGPYVGTRVHPVKQCSGIVDLLKRLAKRVVNPNTQRLPPLAPGRMLEVGCASGAFLHQMAGKGWEVQGIEFSAEAAQAAAGAGHRVHAGPLETAPPPEEPFDLIVGWMVLEHLHDPIGGLRRLREWAKPGAWLVVSVPNAASLEFRFFKEKWYALHVPNHLHHFTPDTLGRVLQAGGWTLEKVWHQHVLHNLIGSLGFVLRHRGYARIGQSLIEFPERGGRWSYALFPLAWLLGVWGQTGRMTVWARVSP